MTSLRRIGFLLAWVPMLPFFAVLAPGSMVVAGLCWLGGASEDRCEGIMLNRAVLACYWLPFKVLGKEPR